MRRLLVLLATTVALTACATETPPAANPVLDGSGDVAAGAELFTAHCAQCHGPDAGGSDNGPSFLSDIYIPSHHADGAFLLAVRNGVQPHHWDFGPMPPQPGLSDQDVADIVAWVRQQQRTAGLIEQ
ncbi:c-type cytochrome [Euzebya tangerina]|uniref:c-type cytochrome n=1 Tax=Euzebya tangerina TaxID=591198 RepID=UPI00196AE785|nr:cytochrome c [Euzebya tangerina]